jgi:predicted Fe-Mo cluster-binding NifX family protein
MKIAIGTDDKKTIRKGHFGESAYYAIVEVLNGQITSREIRENPRAGGEVHHGESEKILDLLHDCELFMARSMGKGSMAKIAEKKVDCIITEFPDIDEALRKFLDAEDEGFQYYDFKREKLIPCSERLKK